MIDYTSYITPYSNAQAERGKFVTIDDNYLQTFGYPATGQGRFAVLTKEVDPVNFQDTATDAFGRLRVSEPYTMFNSKFVTDKNEPYWNEIVNGTSTSTHVSADAMVTLSVSASSDYAIRQTRQRFTYQAGKSVLTFMTFTSGEIQTNVLKRVGLYHGSTAAPYDDTLDGIYFESNGLTNQYYFCIGKTEGTNVGTNSVSQSAWNVDKMDGTGASRIALDFSKNQILYMDYEWLGVGKVRCGFVVNGALYIAHEFKHTNITQGVYMISPNLPVRYEIRGAGNSSCVGKFGQICSSVLSEGPYDPYGNVLTVSRDVTGIGTFSTANIAAGQTTPLLSIRLKQNYNSNSINLMQFSIIADGNMAGVYQVMVLRNASYSTDDGSWASLANSGIEYKGNSTIASRITAMGTMVNAFYYTAPSNITTFQSDAIADTIALGSAINGTSDRIDIAIKKIVGNDNSNMYASLTFRELR